MSRLRPAALGTMSAVLLAGPALAAQSPEQAYIPFASSTGIDGWRAVDDSLYIRSRNQWYKADFFGPCIGLQFDPTIGFVTRFGSTFDRSSSILVDGHECKLSSLIEVAAPPDTGTAAASDTRPDNEHRDGAARSSGNANAGAHAASADGAGDGARAGNSRKSGTARIPFANLGGIEDWKAVGDDTLYVEGRNDQWYRAKLFAPCQGLPFETSIGFVVEPTGSFDRFSSILVNGHECPLASLTKADGPPGSRRAEASPR